MKYAAAVSPSTQPSLGRAIALSSGLGFMGFRHRGEP